MIKVPKRPLYKYLSLNSDQAPTWQERLDHLLCGRCFLSSPADFNDPFDCLPFIDSPSTQEALTEWRENLIPAMALAIRPDGPIAAAVPERFLRDRIGAALASLSPRELNEKLQIAASLNAQRMGVFCLAECIDSVLMWSHYASDHRGIALQFDFRNDLKADLAPLWKVTYQMQRPVVTDLHSGDPALSLADALAIKANFWKYEQEWRIMRSDQARTSVNFDPRIITGIVFGANISTADKDTLNGIAAERGLEVRRMEPDRTTFKLSMVRA